MNIFHLTLVGIGALVSYILLVILTDIRIDKIRPYMNEEAIRVGVQYGIMRYKEEHRLGDKFSSSAKDKWTGGTPVLAIDQITEASGF